MKSIAVIKISHLKERYVLSILLMLYGAIFLYALRQYIQWQSVNVILGLIALPFVVIKWQDVYRSLRYGWMASLSALLALLLPVNTLLYFAILFAIFFVIENLTGKLNELPLLVAALMSPVFQYAANTFSFPVRLNLSEWAGNCLRLIGNDIIVKGNVIIKQGQEFAVDPACMGLSMMITSLLISLLLIAVYQKRYGLRWSEWMLTLFLLIVVAMNVLCNLVRIIFLVQFTVLPGTVMHEVAGIFCLLIYVVLPSSLLARWVTQRFGKSLKLQANTCQVGLVQSYIVHMLVGSTILLAAIRIAQRNENNQDISSPVPSLQGYTAKRFSSGIIKLENEHALVYIKSITGFYSADHSPLICWKGSGYILQQVEQKKLCGLEVYTALLINGKDHLHTAWWYDNGSIRTTAQLTWRWKMLKNGAPFSIINVTTSSQETLEAELRKISIEDQFKKLL